MLFEKIHIFICVCYLSVNFQSVLSDVDISEELIKNVTALHPDAGWFLELPEFQDFLNQNQSAETTESPDLDLRNGRMLALPEPVGGPECSGSFMTLSPGDSVSIKSHNSFGLTPYPANYLVRGHS